MPTALVIGASGTLGGNLVNYLTEKNWTVIGVAKRPRRNEPKNVKMIHCDLRNKEEARKLLKDQISGVTHMYYCALIQREGMSETERTKENMDLLRSAVELTEELASQSLRHIYLQTGTKWYGMEKGPSGGYLTPSREDFPRLKEPIFYYPMEDYLRDRQKGRNWTWSSARPDAIIGFVSENAMSLGLTLAVYAMICREEGKSFVYPGSEKSYRRVWNYTDANLLCKAVEWMSTTEACKNQAFNVTNGDVQRNELIWPEIAAYFGLRYEIAQKPMKLSDMMKGKEEVWKRIVQKYKLENYELSQLVTWEFADFYLSFEWDNITDVNKLREYGFKETTDSLRLWRTFFDRIAKLKVIPDKGQLQQ